MNALQGMDRYQNKSSYLLTQGNTIVKTYMTTAREP